MNNYAIIIALACTLALSGCQNWQTRDVEDLPPTASLPETRTQGEVQIRYWYDLSGAYLTTLTEHPSYPDSPDEIDTLTSLELPESKGFNYGAMVQGLISPPETGLYQFFVSGDDQTEFWLGTSDQPESAQAIAVVPGWTDSRNYSKYDSQKSGLIELDEGQFYYFQVRYKEGIGESHFSVAWQGPGLQQQVISGSALYSLSSERYPDDEASANSFARGYAVGYFDAQQNLNYNPMYPPLDKDNDGLYDNWETFYGLSNSAPGDATSDSDDDLMTATDEFFAGTAPNNTDSDGDGIPDGVEFAFSLNPTDPSDAVDDFDGDGATNLEEYQAGTNMNDAEDVPSADPVYVAGFTGQYFSGRNFDQQTLVRNDQSINYWWGTRRPTEEMPVDDFSIRWTGFFQPPHSSGSQAYEFHLATDDGARLYLGNELAIDRWVLKGATTDVAKTTLSAEETLPITVEYFEATQVASAKLLIIESESGSLLQQSEVITSIDPAVSADLDTDGDSLPDTWELTYGTSPMLPDADQVLNDRDITTLEAYTSNLNPRTLEPLSGAAPTTPTSTDSDSTTQSQSIQLSWTAPGTRTDGSSIALSEIDHYEIAYGQDPGDLNTTVRVEGGEDFYRFNGLASGIWYFSIRVHDTNGLVSQYSEPVDVVVE